jgi:hypothetical protein
MVVDLWVGTQAGKPHMAVGAVPPLGDRGFTAMWGAQALRPAKCCRNDRHSCAALLVIVRHTRLSWCAAVACWPGGCCPAHLYPLQPIPRPQADDHARSNPWHAQLLLLTACCLVVVRGLSSRQLTAG